MDKNNFSDLYSASRNDLYKYCRSLCGNDADAQDLMQQTYLKALESIEKLYDENFPAWLCSVARNIFLDNLRKSRYSAEELPEIPDNSQNPEFIAEKRDIGRILLKALKNSLSPVQRATVIFYYYDEKTVSEIANIMQVSENTVKSRLFNARKKLREELKKFGNIFTCVSLATATLKYKLKNIRIPINARITASAVLTVTAMTAVSMTNIQTENKLPDTVITINETNTSIPETTGEKILKSSETAFIDRLSDTTTNSVYYTMPTSESHTIAFKSKYEDFQDIIEELTEGETQEEGDTPEETQPTTTENITEYEEETTMKKEIISAVTALTTAFSTATTITTVAEDITDRETTTYEATMTETEPTEEESSTVEETEITFPVGIALCIVTPTGDNPRNPNVLYTGDAHVTFSQTDEKGEIIKEMGEWNLSDIGRSVVKVKFEQTVYSEEETVYFMWTIDNIDEGYYPMWGWEETPGVIHSMVTVDPKKRERWIRDAESNAEAVAMGVPEDYLACPECVIELLPNNAVRDESTTDGTYLIYGDANLDSNVTISDSVAILQHIANNEKYPLDDNARANADVYNPGDGITGNDANSIMKLDAGIIDSLPETLS